jgi:tubby and related proteins
MQPRTPPRNSIDGNSDFPLTYPASGSNTGSRRDSVNLQYAEDNGKDIVSREGREFEGSQSCTSATFPNILTAYISGPRTEHVYCVVTRDRSNMMYPSYEMRLQDTDQLLIVAKKTSLGRMSSYHFYDMSQAQTTKQLTKKSENYIGKLRSVSSGRTEFVLVDHTPEQAELGGYMFDRLEVQPKMQDGSDGVVSPRKLSVVLPLLNSLGHPVSNRMTQDQDQSLSNYFRKSPSVMKVEAAHTFGTKSPVLVNGNFRLNFKGRVSVPSIKNFQLIPDDELNNVILQFGKVDDDKFHLDFKAPFNALQAFAAALSQFSM